MVEEMFVDLLVFNFKMGKFLYYGNVVDLCGVSVLIYMYWLDDGIVLFFVVMFFGGSGYDVKVLDVVVVLEVVVGI